MTQTHLFRRGATYYLRRRLPAAFAKAIGRTQIVKSLKTSDPRIACRRVRRASAQLDHWFSLMTKDGHPPTAADLQRIITRVFKSLLDRDELERASRLAVSEDVAEYEIYVEVPVDPGDPDAPDQAFRLRSVVEAEHAIDEWADRLARNEFGAIAPDLDAAMMAEGVTLDKSSPAYRLLLHRSARAALQAAKVGLDRENNVYAEDNFDIAALSAITPAEARLAAAPSISTPPPAPQPVPAPPSAPAKPSAPLMSEAFETLRAAKIGTDWSQGGKDHRDSKNAVKFWVELMGDRPINAITSTDAFAFRTKLAKIPTLNGKGVFAGLTALDMIARADAIEAGTFQPTKGAEAPSPKPVPRLAAKTLNKYMTYFTTLYNFKPIKDLGFGHPFEGTLFKAGVTERQNSRFPWPTEDLQTLFRSPIWTGCAGPLRRARAGSEMIRDSQYWAPLVMLFAGLRLEEFAGLTSSDVCERNGIWCIEIRPTAVRSDLKTDSARRTVPIHPALHKLGFVEFAKAQKLKLFPECLPGGPEGRLGYRLSKQHTNYRRNIGLTNPSIDLHALRHNMTDALQNAGVSTGIIAYLLGHKPLGMTDRVYHRRGASDRYEIETLSAAINKVAYPGLEFLGE